VPLPLVNVQVRSCDTTCVAAWEAVWVPDWVPTPENRRYMAAVGQVEELVYRMMREGPANRASLLGMLLNSEMSEVEIRDEVMTFFMAGHETTALALTWGLYLLAGHASARDRLFAVYFARSL